MASDGWDGQWAARQPLVVPAAVAPHGHEMEGASEALREGLARLTELLRRREVVVGLVAAAGVAAVAVGVSRLVSGDGSGSGSGKGGVATATTGAVKRGVAGVASHAGTSAEEAAHDKVIEGDFIDQEALGISMEDVGGLEPQIREIEELILLPLSHPHLYSHSKIAQRPTGVLLYGPPGTGKTLLARAVAATAKASFLPVNVAHLESKWFGETPKLVEAIFRVARRHAPCVMFVDEIDGFLATRQEGDMQHVNTMKTKFMEMWDGLASAMGEAPDQWVLIVGATNKPWALDPAVLRRMPRQIHVGLPDAQGRTDILSILLRSERVAAGLDLAPLASATEGYSGSDLKEVVRAAVLVPIREAYSSEMRAARGGGGKSVPVTTPRPITLDDLMLALDSVKPTGAVARSYRITNGASFARPGAAAPPAMPASGQVSTPTMLARAGGASAVAPPASAPRGSSPGDEPEAGRSSPSLVKPTVSHAFMSMGPSSRLNSVLLSAALEAVQPGHATTSHSGAGSA